MSLAAFDYVFWSKPFNLITPPTLGKWLTNAVIEYNCLYDATLDTVFDKSNSE